MPCGSVADVLNSIVNQSGTTATATPSRTGRGSSENQTDSGIATPINTPSNSTESGLVVHLEVLAVEYLLLDRDVALAFKNLREQQKNCKLHQQGLKKCLSN